MLFMKYLVPIVVWCLIIILCANRGNAAGIGDHDLQTLGTIDIDNNLGLIQYSGKNMIIRKTVYILVLKNQLCILFLFLSQKVNQTGAMTMTCQKTYKISPLI